MYLYYFDEVRYWRDLPFLRYHFSKLGDEGIADLLKPRSDEPTAEEQRRLRGWQKFIAGYGLSGGIGADGAREFLAALGRRRVPAWALLIAPLDEIRDAAGGGEE